MAMAKKLFTTEELLNRWGDLEAEEKQGETLNDSLSRPKPILQQKKEEWFADAFDILTFLPRENHILCGSYVLMGLLGDSFYNYFKDDCCDSALKIIWVRISEEMRQCAQCIFQHHQAQARLNVEYEFGSVGPLLNGLMCFDEERVTQHLQELNARIARGKYTCEHDGIEVVSVMFEVLMYPHLLDDQSLFAEFQMFIEGIDDIQELALGCQHQYPGIYALLFSKSARVCSIAHRLAVSKGKIRSASDMEPLQPLLKKFIYFLETEELPSTLEISRPRMQLERESVWRGVSLLLGFLERTAIESGILERYPAFLSILFNHINNDSLEFLHAVKCLRGLFEMLGCKLWLWPTLSPSMMRDMLLSQCFHTQSEGSHEEIFYLLQLFLQSLEALQDGEHELHRKHILYFLLHKVSVANNFSGLTRKKAHEVALLIIHRGYRMKPSRPPYDCAHLWGPSLVSSLKDFSVDNCLRQNAFDLLQTIIVSDATALIKSFMACHIHSSVSSNSFAGFDDERTDGCLPIPFNVQEGNNSWSQFREQSKVVYRECSNWMCIPMLWIDALINIDLSIVPSSFSNAVIWARSRFAMADPESSVEMLVSVRDWLTSSATEISSSFGWNVETDGNNCGHGGESGNSIKVLAMNVSLVRTFKRLTAHFIVQMEREEPWKKWSWEPMMGESLILLLLDLNDSVRQVGNCILAEFSKTQELTTGLQFLCSRQSSLHAIFLGLGHSLKLIQLDSGLSNFLALDNFFFVLCKILSEGFPPQVDKSNDSIISTFSLDDKVLRQSFVDSLLVMDHESQCDVDFKFWEMFCGSLAKSAWPFIKKCLVEGKAFVDDRSSQVTCLRLLEVLPVVFEKLFTSFHKVSEHSAAVEDAFDFKWISDFVDWGKSSVEIILRCWRQSVIFFLNSVKGAWDNKYTAIIMNIEKLVSCDGVDTHELAKHISRLSILLSYEAPNNGKAIHSKALCSDGFLIQREFSTSDAHSSILGEDDVQILHSETVADRKVDKNVIVLSDDEIEKDASPSMVVLSHRTGLKKSFDDIIGSSSLDMVHKKDEGVMAGLVDDSKIDPWELAVKSTINKKLCITKPMLNDAESEVIQYSVPMQSRSVYLHKLEAKFKRFLGPNLDEWYRHILEINYFAAVGLSNPSDDENQSTSILKKIPISFQSPDQYVEIFRPLVLEEFKAQLHNSFLEMSSLEDMHCGILSILSVERLDNFYLVRCVHDDSDSSASRQCSENDLVLLTRQPLRNSFQDVHLVGKVEKREKDNRRRTILLIKFSLQTSCFRLDQARRFIFKHSKWYISRIMSITSQLREFHALSSVKYIPILPIILNPGVASLGCQESQEFNLCKLSQPLQKILKSSFNDSQLQAISVAIGSANSNNDFELSLIQGPPGTGKTRTIVAIVSGLLASPVMRPNEMKTDPYSNPNMSNPSCTNVKSTIGESESPARTSPDAAFTGQMDNDVAKNLNTMDSFARRRVLICAQSNAAVDELVSRIYSQGLYDADGGIYKPYLVRVGNSKTVHPNSLPFFIDTLVSRRLAEERVNLGELNNDLCGDSSAALCSNLENLVESIRFCEAKCSLSGENSDLGNSWGDKVPEETESKLRTLYQQKNDLCKDLATIQVREKRESEGSKALKHRIRKSILREAEIVVTTLSGCGGDLYAVCSETSAYKFGNTSETSLFDAVVIDEAAQALEPATLIPLQLLRSSGAKCILVGDPKQLPATVLSTVVSKYHYQCSMFERLQRANYPVTMLTKQYRMHPEICRFPSMHFYDNKLINGDWMPQKYAKFHETEILGPYVVFDIVDGQEVHGKNSGAFSLYNEHEVDVAIQIVEFFRKRYPSEFCGGRIGILTPYKRQLSLLRARFSSSFGTSVVADMEFNTIDGFQGREVDILLLSTVRAANVSSAEIGINRSCIGFVADVRRMNVALTRAKLSLWVLGNAKTLQTDPNWAALVNDAKERNLVISCKRPYQSFFESASQLISVSESHDIKLATGGSGMTNVILGQKRKREPGDEHELSIQEEAIQCNKSGNIGESDLPPNELISSWHARAFMDVNAGREIDRKVAENMKNKGKEKSL